MWCSSDSNSGGSSNCSNRGDSSSGSSSNNSDGSGCSNTGVSRGADELLHSMVIMSLNCKGLRARNGKSKKGKAHASTLARRSMLAKIVNQHKPQVLALQETWHLPHNDSMQVEGYWYYGRPRVTPDGKRTTSGGVGFLVLNKFGMGNVNSANMQMKQAAPACYGWT